MGVWTGIIFIIINICGFILMGLDKNRAKKGQYRISERALWVTAICGGAVGTTMGMNLFRHKTKHAHFRIGFPSLVVIQLVLIYLYFAH